MTDPKQREILRREFERAAPTFAERTVGRFDHMERFDLVRRFIEEHGHETGMHFERRGDDWAFERRRLMLLCERA